jgi:hypothetical protein
MKGMQIGLKQGRIQHFGKGGRSRRRRFSLPAEIQAGLMAGRLKGIRARLPSESATVT